MNKTKLVTTAFTTLILFLVSPLPTAADDWFWGTGFRVGKFHFNIGHRGNSRGYYGPRAGHYYRVSHRIPSRYRCTDRCFVRSRQYYHHSSCPVLGGHFRSHRVDLDYAFDHYAPRHRRSYRDDRHWDRGYRDHSYRDDSYRHHRRQERRYPARHYRRGHRHDYRCYLP